MITGAVFHFAYLVTLILMSMSTFNYTIAVYEVRAPGDDGILKRHSKLLLTVELTLAIVIAAAIVTAVLLTASYHADLLLITCIPKTRKAYSYSILIPSMISGIAGFIMAFLIILRMRKVQTVKYLEFVFVCACVCACVCKRLSESIRANMLIITINLIMQV